MNDGPWIRRPWRTLSRASAGAAGLCVVTALSYPFHPDFAVVGCLYLLVIVVQARFGGFAAAAITSVVAVLALDYFFVPPLFSLQIDNPAYGLALITFLATALVITRLASKAQEEARRADARSHDLALLYELASQLVSVSPDAAVKREYLGIFRDVFGMRAVCLFDGVVAAGGCDGISAHDLARLTREAYTGEHDYESAAKGVIIRCLRASGRPVGAIGFEGLRDAESTAGPLSMLAVAMIQRAHYTESANQAAAVAQVEGLRSAILDAFAHQFKTPLAAIMTAAGSLREIGPLLPAQAEMADTIETEATGLGSLTTRLLRMARLDRDEIRPNLQVTDLVALVSRVTDQFRGRWTDHKLVVQASDQPVEVLSDPELLSLAVVQLVDNALRYSHPASIVLVRVTAESCAAGVFVTNEGNSIPRDEQGRIFDRFYRGSAGHQAQGTGLGLYVARKIVLAHGGILKLDKDHTCGPHTTFYLKLPIAREENDDEYIASQSTDRGR